MVKPNFIELGYFPEELPPCFTSAKFGKFCNKKSLSKFLPKSSFITPTGVKPVHRTRLTKYNATKRGRNRREFSIPNPVSFHDTCFFLSKHWVEILKFIEKSKDISFSIPEVDGLSRAIKFTPHSEIPAIKLLKLGGHKVVLQTDISRFYHSVYTHSLPWAFHGKAKSKKDTSATSKDVFFNKIDEIIRNGQDGQTIGLPVGTDTSRVLAEVVSVAIDTDFIKKNPKISFLRHVDDAWFGARTINQAKKILSDYRVHLRDFELDVNDSKTNIRSFSILSNDEWPEKLRAYLDKIESHEVDERKLDAFIQFYSYSFEAANIQKDDAIVKYSIKLLDTNQLWEQKFLWLYIEKYLAACALNFPHSVDYVAQVISWKERTTKKISNSLWKKVFSEMIMENAPRQNDHEVAWALWAIMDLDLKVSAKVITRVIDYCGNVPVILAVHLLQSKKVIGNVNADPWKKIDTSSSITQNWLLLHEASVNGWLPKSHTFSYDHSFLKELREKKISFFNAKAEPPSFVDFSKGSPKNPDSPMWPKNALARRNSGYDSISDEDISF